MKKILNICLAILFVKSGGYAQSNCETTLAIESFVSQIDDSTDTYKNIYFCKSYLPIDMQCKLPFKVNKIKCTYFLIEDVNKLCKKQNFDYFFTVKGEKNNNDTINFWFSYVSVIIKKECCEVASECRGVAPVAPDIRIINTKEGERIILSRITQISNRGIIRKMNYTIFSCKSSQGC